jgi:hypothetical protein
MVEIIPVAGGELSDSTVPIIYKYNFAVVIDDDSNWMVDQAVLSRGSVAGKPFSAVPGDGLNRSGLRIHLTDAIIVVVADKQIAGGIKRDTTWSIERRENRWAAIT